MLTALQRRLAEMIAALPESQGFALAGGAALILRGEVDRATDDLDYFGRDAQAVATLADAVERAVVEAGMSVQPVQRAEGFVRMIVVDAHEQCRLDIAQDARIRPVEQTEDGAVLALEELAADKVLALFGRAEPRDFVCCRTCGAIRLAAAAVACGREGPRLRRRLLPGRPASV